MAIQTQNLRGVIWPLLNPDTGLLCCDVFSWKTLESAPGVMAFDAVERAIGRAKSIKRFALLRFVPDAPDWVKNPAADYLRLIAALGERFGAEPTVLGVDVLYPEGVSAQEAVQTFAHAFGRARLFVQAGGEAEQAAKATGRVGVIVTADSLSDYEPLWRELPLRMAVDPSKPDEIAFAVAHHVSILETRDAARANAATHAGYRFKWESVLVDDSGKDEGHIDVELTLSNAGGLPCYTQASLYMRLCGSGVPDARVYPMPFNVCALMPGESAHVRASLDVHNLMHGEYDVHAGVFFDHTDYPASFGIEGRISDGYYEGRIILRL